MSTESHTQITLDDAAGVGVLAVLVQEAPEPVIQGDDPEGVNYLCSGCGSLLVAQTTASSLWDLAIECARCHAESATPLLPPGRALPPGTLVVDLGRYLIGRTLNQPSTVTMAGRQAADRRQREVGANPAAGSPSAVLGLEMLEELLRRTEEMFAGVLETLERSHERSRKSATPGEVHPLMQYLDDVRAAARAFSMGGTVELSSVIELHSLIGQLERWQHDPATPLIIRTVANGDDVPHTIAVLTMAGYLADTGNAVEIVVDPNATVRAADLRIVTTARHHAAVEVKTPVGLRAPSEALSAEVAYHEIDEARRSAGTGTRGQLSPAQPGFLVVAGSRLRDEDLDRLEAAPEQQLNRRGRDRPHIAGIVIVNTGSSVSDGRVATIAGSAAVRPVLNKFYSGKIAVETAEQDWMAEMSGRFDVTRSGSLTAVVDVPTTPTTPTPSRNQPCWCGSGKKYKRCHGR